MMFVMMMMRYVYMYEKIFFFVNVLCYDVGWRLEMCCVMWWWCLFDFGGDIFCGCGMWCVWCDDVCVMKVRINDWWINIFMIDLWWFVMWVRIDDDVWLCFLMCSVMVVIFFVWMCVVDGVLWLICVMWCDVNGMWWVILWFEGVGCVVWWRIRCEGDDWKYLKDDFIVWRRFGLRDARVKAKAREIDDDDVVNCMNV